MPPATATRWLATTTIGAGPAAPGASLDGLGAARAIASASANAAATRTPPKAETRAPARARAPIAASAASVSAASAARPARRSARRDAASEERSEVVAVVLGPRASFDRRVARPRGFREDGARAPGGAELAERFEHRARPPGRTSQRSEAPCFRRRRSGGAAGGGA